MQTLYTPWRLKYISMNSASEECFLCAAAENPGDPERLVVHATDHHLVILNLHPYTNGHLMVAPLPHLASPADSAPDAREEFWPLVLQTQDVLARAYSPHGFNIGSNLGRAAGAGVPGHFHFHVVPRWDGDTNFMSVVAGVRLIPEEPLEICRRLRRVFSDEDDR